MPTLLLVEDDAAVRRALVRMLGTAFEVASAGSCAEGCAMLDARAFDIVVCDYALGDGTAEQVLTAARERQPKAHRAIVSAAAPPGAEALAELIVRKPPPRDLATRLLALFGDAG